ncbi:MAG: anti-sigma factor [Rubrobacteraceae bacterium]
MNRERFEELKDAYALGALPKDEEREMEEYLAEEPALRSEVEELSALSSLLAFSPVEYEPPNRLRRNIMDAVRSGTDRQGAGESSAGERLRSYLSLQRFALGAAAVVLVALLSWNVSLQAGDDLQTYELQGTGAAQDTRAEVVEMEENKFVLLAEDMPSPPEGETMQVWVIQNGEPKSGGTFEPKDGLAAAPITLPDQGADAVAITVEPAGGSDQPTSDPVLQTEL